MMDARSRPFLACWLALLVALAPPSGAEELEKMKVKILHKPEGCSGARKAVKGDEVSMHYQSWNMEGKEIFSTYDHNQPSDVIVGKKYIIKGVSMALIGMCEGEKRRVKIPPHLAYGEEGYVPYVAPNSPIVADVELVSIRHHPFGPHDGGMHDEL